MSSIWVFNDLNTVIDYPQEKNHLILFIPILLKIMPAQSPHAYWVFDVATIDLITKTGEAVQLSVLFVSFIATPLHNTIICSVTSLPHP